MSTPVVLAFSNIWYVCSVNGIDGGGTAGLNRARPLATIAQAYANASSGEIICCLAGHSERPGATLTIAKSLVIVGQGSVGGDPAVQFQSSGLGFLGVFDITAVGVELRNLWFTTSFISTPSPRARANNAGLRVIGCRFDCAENDIGPALQLIAGASQARITSTRFVSTALTPAAQPESALKVSANIVDLELDSVTFDAGASGFSNFYALAATGFTITRVKAQSITQLRGADINLGANSTGWINPQTTSGGARVDFNVAVLMPNGVGEVLGDTLATCKPLEIIGTVWYVSSAVGTDAVSPAGQNRERPLRTLQQAVTNAADGDIVVLMAGHDELVAGTIALAKKLAIVAGGQSLGLPTAKLTPPIAASLFSVTTNCVQLRNIWVRANPVASATARIAVSGADFRMEGCYVECSATDTGPGLALAAGADRAIVSNSTFISTALSTAAQPESAVKITGAIADLELEELTISGGTFGYSNIWALDGTPAAVTRLRGRSVNLVSNANAKLNPATTGYVDLYLTSSGPDF